MPKKFCFFVSLFFLLMPVGAFSQEQKSFSKQMNEIKRSGSYVYAEASAPNENDAKAACDALLKIEITKHFAAEEVSTRSGARLIKDISDYNREYLVQPRSEMIRVFGFVAKSDISGKTEQRQPTAPAVEQPATTAPTVEQPAATAPAVEQPAATAPTKPTVEQPAATAPAVEQPAATAPTEPTVEQPLAAQQSVQSSTALTLHTDGCNLAKWQIDMLQKIVEQPDMLQVRKVLNRYKAQNRIKRIGANTTANNRAADSFYIIFDESGSTVALLAPSSTNSHYNMSSGSTINFDKNLTNQYLWFQISK